MPRLVRFALSSSLLLYWLFLRLFFALFLLILLGMCCAGLTHLTPLSTLKNIVPHSSKLSSGSRPQDTLSFGKPLDFAGSAALSGSLPPKVEPQVR